MQYLRDYGVWLGLLITLVLVYAVEQQENEDDLVVKQPNSKALKQLSDSPENISSGDESFLLRQQISDKPINLFAVSQNMQSEQTNEFFSVEPEPPASPYRYVGKLIEGDEIIVFLANGRDNYAVREGDVLDGTWQVKFISPPEMALQFLPLNTQVSIEVGELL